MNWLNAEKLIRDAYHKMDALPRAKFDELYDDADLHFEFAFDATMGAVARSASLIVSELAKLPHTQTGEIDLKGTRITNLIGRLRVHHGIKGPLFNIVTVMHLGDPTIPALGAKLSKTYKSNAPIELLAYIGRNIMFPANVWKPGAEEFFQRVGSLGPFRRIWIVDLVEKTIEFEQNAP